MAAGLYRPAVAPYQFQFPRDHAAHPEYQTEWWYYTGHLARGDRKYGFELTFFQVGLDPRRKSSPSAWAPHTIYLAHFTLTDETRGTFRFREAASRPALGLAGSDPRRYHVWLHDWYAKLLPDGRTQRLHAATSEFALTLDLSPGKPPAIHGTDGVSQKSAGVGHASHYYSMTRLVSRGELVVDGEKQAVTGLTWMDHEFGSSQLTPRQTGWDWYSIQLDDNRDLMLYVLRLKDGGIEPLSSGTLVGPDGACEHLSWNELQVRATGNWKSPHSGASYPSGWRVQVSRENLDLTLQPVVLDQELWARDAGSPVYWEGSVRVAGHDQGKPAHGVGYVELTGYSGAAPGI